MPWQAAGMIHHFKTHIKALLSRQKTVCFCPRQDAEKQHPTIAKAGSNFALRIPITRYEVVPIKSPILPSLLGVAMGAVV